MHITKETKIPPEAKLSSSENLLLLHCPHNYYYYAIVGIILVNVYINLTGRLIYRIFYCLPIPVFHFLLMTSSDSILISGVLSWTSDWFVFLRRLPSTLNFSLRSRKSSWPSYRFFILNWDPPAC